MTTEILDICHSARKICEQIMGASNLESVEGTCLYASYLLRGMLVKFAECEAVIRGGGAGPFDFEGLCGTDGMWYGHYWVEGKTKDGVEFVADITGDQFGRPPVNFIFLPEARATYKPGNQEEVDEAVRDEFLILERT